MTDAQPTTAPLYGNVRVAPTVIFGGKDGNVDGYRIDFTVAGGVDHYILVPTSDFDPDDIEDQVADWAQKIAKVLTMEGPLMQLDADGKVMAPSAS